MNKTSFCWKFNKASYNHYS